LDSAFLAKEERLAFISAIMRETLFGVKNYPR
jgi:hypothetical protein